VLVIFLEDKNLRKDMEMFGQAFDKNKNSFDKEKLKSNIKWNQVGWFPDTIKMSGPH
jgi:hypothetical protein